MSTTDATFLWETEALRESTRKRRLDAPVARPPEPEPPPTGWVTLREAHEATGIPVGTLRKWARRESIPSRLDEEGKGARRMIRMRDVENRARLLGREIAPIATDSVERAEMPSMSTIAEPTPDAPHALVDLSDDGDLEADGPRVAVTVEPAAPEEGTMIVPIAAWDKMLMQLGNLHEAGQQLAEARERAARAETENQFLKERLAEIRTRMAADEPGSLADTAAEPEPVSATADAGPAEAASSEPAVPASPGRRLMRSLQRWRIEVRRH